MTKGKSTRSRTARVRQVTPTYDGGCYWGSKGSGAVGPMPPEGYPIHPICLEQPAMAPDQYEALVASIQRDGLREPIYLLEEKVLDGRHRQRACIELGVDVRFLHLEGDHEFACSVEMLDWSIPEEELIPAHREELYRKAREWVEVRNLHRRDLSKQQRACCAARHMDEEQVEALARAKEGTPAKKFAGVGKASKILGARFAVSDRYIEKAHRLLKEAPDLFDRVLAGEKGLTLAAAIGELNERGRSITEPVPEEEGDDQGAAGDEEPEQEERPEMKAPPLISDEVIGKVAPELAERTAIQKHAPYLLEELPLELARKVYRRMPPPCRCGSLTEHDAEQLVRAHMRGRQVTIPSAVAAVLAAGRAPQVPQADLSLGLADAIGKRRSRKKAAAAAASLNPVNEAARKFVEGIRKDGLEVTLTAPGGKSVTVK